MTRHQVWRDDTEAELNAGKLYDHEIFLQLRPCTDFTVAKRPATTEPIRTFERCIDAGVLCSILPALPWLLVRPSCPPCHTCCLAASFQRPHSHAGGKKRRKKIISRLLQHQTWLLQLFHTSIFVHLLIISLVFLIRGKGSLLIYDRSQKFTRAAPYYKKGFCRKAWKPPYIKT